MKHQLPEMCNLMSYSSRPGALEFCNWRLSWAANCQVDPILRVFLADQYLPYWLQCNQSKCGKWKQIAMKGPLTREFIAKFVCGMRSDGTVVSLSAFV